MNIEKELKKDGLLLKKIPKKNQTMDICKIAVKQNPLVLQFVSKKCLDFKFCMSAVKKDCHAFRYVPDQYITKEMCELAVEGDSQLLNNVPEEFRTLEICMNAIKKEINVLPYVPKEFRTLEICMNAIKEDLNAWQYIPKEIRYKLFDNNIEISLIDSVIACAPNWLIYMSDRSDIVELCIRYMEKDFSIAQYIPEQIKTSAEILSYQKSKGKLSFVKKYYDSRIKSFGIEIKVLYGQLKSEYYRVFNHYTPVYNFLMFA